MSDKSLLPHDGTYGPINDAQIAERVSGAADYRTPGLGPGHYRTIVADPPWRVHRPKGGWRTGLHTSQPLTYPTMSVEEIKALPVDGLAAETAHLYIWTINRYIEDTYAIARAWGFGECKPTLLVWGKKPMGFGSGGVYSLTTEYILFARRGSEGRNPEKRWHTSWFEWPRGKHSQKPEAFQDIVEQVSPAPRVELFARRDRLGWDTWGNEALGTAEMPEAAGVKRSAFEEEDNDG